MSIKEFKENGYKVIDWIADYYENIESYPVLSNIKPGELRKNLPKSPPQNGENFNNILSDMNDKIIPGITHWQSPNFFAYFPCNATGPAILGDLLSSGLGVQGMLWASSPACTELESHVLDWLVDMLRLPKKFKSTTSGGGVIQDTASSATLCALIAAREKISNGKINESGFDDSMRVYTSIEAHSSIEKAVKIAGIGSKNLRLIEVDQNFAMDPIKLREAINNDINNGKTPAFVCATIGTTSSTAIDPLKEIGKICDEFGIWLHVDAAMAGSTSICPEYQFINDGIEYADSYCFNPHKFLLTNFDCSCLYISDKEALIKSLTINPEYLKTEVSDLDTVFDYRDWQVPLGRRFRALKLWSVIRYYGISGIQSHIRVHIKAAKILSDLIMQDNRFEIMAPTVLNLVCFRYKASDQFNTLLLNKLNKSGALYLVHTKLNNKYTIRFSIGQTNTTEEHVVNAWKFILKTTEGMEKDGIK
ncbi:aminotransferase class V-fold PLP-dependent enzyme [bacterium]|nr:MAG: aminotransferase class V-fold PLP-dependent enzyme [bacterium]